MTKRELVEALDRFPDDAIVCLSTLLLHATDEGDKGETYKVVLDQPIQGIAFHEEDRELRFVVVTKTYADAAPMSAFGVSSVDFLTKRQGDSST